MIQSPGGNAVGDRNVTGPFAGNVDAEVLVGREHQGQMIKINARRVFKRHRIDRRRRLLARSRAYLEKPDDDIAGILDDDGRGAGLAQSDLDSLPRCRLTCDVEV